MNFLEPSLALCQAGIDLVAAATAYLIRVQEMIAHSQNPNKPIYFELLIDAQLALSNALVAAKFCVQQVLA